MVANGNISPLSRLMQVTTQALNECQETMCKTADANGKGKLPEGLDAKQAERLLKLMETLVDTKNQLTTEIESERISYIDPDIISEMEVAIEKAISNPIDAKVNQIYFSIFGYNSALWKVLRDMQKLLQTAGVHKERTGRRVVKVDKKQRELRKKRHERDSITIKEEEHEN
ncbi:MAG TPA: hypothetical protein VGP47_07795 [Parachlamydiaceae bacterium]|nr:hypothetical protein [Parachlamydiaceae bacterium]